MVTLQDVQTNVLVQYTTYTNCSVQSVIHPSVVDVNIGIQVTVSQVTYTIVIRTTQPIAAVAANIAVQLTVNQTTVTSATQVIKNPEKRPCVSTLAPLLVKYNVSLN